VIWLAPSFGKTSRPTPLPLYSSQTPRKKLERNWALAEPSAKRSENWNYKRLSGTEMKKKVQFTRNDPDEMCVHG